MKILTLAEIKDWLGAGPARREVLSCSSLPRGLPKGAITELYGAGKTEFVARVLAEHPLLRAAWIEERLSVFPFALLQRNISLDRVLFVEAGAETLWTALQVLRSQLFPIVILYGEGWELNALRRIQLATEKSQAATLWLTGRAQNLWPVSLQLKIEKHDEEVRAYVVRER